MNRILWVLQFVLALLFLFAGGSKLAMSAADLTAQTPLPAWFLRMVGVLEILGGLGLVLPALLKIQPRLTPIAAACLTGIMIGAVLASLPLGVGMAIFPFVTGLLTTFVAVKRWKA